MPLNHNLNNNIFFLFITKKNFGLKFSTLNSNGCLLCMYGTELQVRIWVYVLSLLYKLFLNHDNLLWNFFLGASLSKQPILAKLFQQYNLEILYRKYQIDFMYLLNKYNYN